MHDWFHMSVTECTIYRKIDFFFFKMSLQSAPNFWDCHHGPLLSEYALQPFVLKLFLDIWAQSSPYLFLTEVKNFHLFLWDMLSLSSNEQDLFSLFRWEVIISELHMISIYSELQISRALNGQETVLHDHIVFLGISIWWASFLCKPVHRIDFYLFY